MLCLTRKRYESIRIGSDIFITINRIHSDKVRIGIEAPDDIEVVRTELDDEAEGDDQ